MSVKIENISFSMTTTSNTPPQEGFDNIANKVMDKLAEICVGSEYNSAEHKLTYYGHEITCLGQGTSSQNSFKLVLKIKKLNTSQIGAGSISPKIPQIQSTLNLNIRNEAYREVTV